MVTDRSPLTAAETMRAREIAAEMRATPQEHMTLMLSLVGTDHDDRGRPEGCWERAIRQAIKNYERMPHVYQ